MIRRSTVTRVPSTPPQMLAVEYIVSQSPKWRKQPMATRIPPEWIGRPDRQYECFASEFAAFAALYGAHDDSAELPEWSAIAGRRGTPHERQAVWFRAHRLAQYGAELVARAAPVRTIVAVLEYSGGSPNAISVGVGPHGLPHCRQERRCELTCLGVVAASTMSSLIAPGWHHVLSPFAAGAKFLHFGCMTTLPESLYGALRIRLETEVLGPLPAIDLRWLGGQTLSADAPLQIDTRTIGVVTATSGVVHVDVYIDASVFALTLLRCAAASALRRPGGADGNSLAFVDNDVGCALSKLADGAHETALGLLFLEYLYLWQLISLPECEECENADPDLRARLVAAFADAASELGHKLN